MPPPCRRLSHDVRAALRFFAYYLGNGTLLTPAVADIDLDYSEALTGRADAIGQVFAVFLNVLREAGECANEWNARHRAAQWLRHLCEPEYIVEPPLAEWELTLRRADEPWKQEAKDFALALGRGELAPELLAGCDYMSLLVDGGSLLERIVTVWSNVLCLDEENRALNAASARYRAAQYLKWSCDRDYVLEPAPTYWEMELAG